jgi:hypothetical protein
MRRDKAKCARKGEMCDASTRQVNFGAFLNFLPLFAEDVWFRVYTVGGQPKGVRKTHLQV